MPFVNDVEWQEREWTDAFGTHFEVRALDGKGSLHAMRVTKSLGGWQPSWDDVRRAVWGSVAASQLDSTERRP